jgi:hypothetical protein
MAFGIAGDADRADAAAPQGAAVDGLERAQRRPALGAVAANDENVGDARVAIESREEIVERRHADEIAHGNVRHGSKPAARSRIGALSDYSAGRFGTALR